MSTQTEESKLLLKRIVDSGILGDTEYRKEILHFVETVELSRKFEVSKGQSKYLLLSKFVSRPPDEDAYGSTENIQLSCPEINAQIPFIELDKNGSTWVVTLTLKGDILLTCPFAPNSLLHRAQQVALGCSFSWTTVKVRETINWLLTVCTLETKALQLLKRFDLLDLSVFSTITPV